MLQARRVPICRRVSHLRFSISVMHGKPGGRTGGRVGPKLLAGAALGCVQCVSRDAKPMGSE